MAKILIVDDEPMIREVIREYVSFEGYEFREAGSGIEAIELCRKEDFDVVVLDLMMPGLTDLRLMKRYGRPSRFRLLFYRQRGRNMISSMDFRSVLMIIW